MHCYHRYLHLLTHSFPTLLSSDLLIGVAPLLVVSACALTLSLAFLLRLSAQHDQRPGSAGEAAIGGSLWAGLKELWSRPFLRRSEEHTSELQSLMRISYAVFCLKKKRK